MEKMEKQVKYRRDAAPGERMPWMARRVQEIDAEGRVIAAWPSLTGAAAAAGHSPSNVSRHIRNGRPLDGRMYRYASPRPATPPRKAIDWTPYAKDIERICHWLVVHMVGVRRYHQAAYDCIVQRVWARLMRYPGRHPETTPVQWIWQSGRYATMWWMADHNANREDTVGDDDCEHDLWWDTVPAPEPMDTIDDVLADMPDDLREMAEMRIDGIGWRQVYRMMGGIGRAAIDERRERLRRWLVDRMCGNQPPDAP